MSGWRIAVRELHELGGGPAPIAALSVDHAALARALDLGLVYRVGWEWKLTHRGRDWADGRLQIDGRPTRVCATWLAALPRPNEIRLDTRFPPMGPCCKNWQACTRRGPCLWREESRLESLKQ